MADFATSSMIQRRQMLEDALAEALQGIAEITTIQGDRCLTLPPAVNSKGDGLDFYPLWEIASDLEVKLK